MVLGFISLILTFGQSYISKICIPSKVADTMLPCKADGKHDSSDSSGDEHRRRLLWFQHRYLAAAATSTECKKVSACHAWTCLPFPATLLISSMSCVSHARCVWIRATSRSLVFSPSSMQGFTGNLTHPLLNFLSMFFLGNRIHGWLELKPKIKKLIKFSAPGCLSRLFNLMISFKIWHNHELVAEA